MSIAVETKRTAYLTPSDPRRSHLLLARHVLRRRARAFGQVNMRRALMAKPLPPRHTFPAGGFFATFFAASTPNVWDEFIGTPPRMPETVATASISADAGTIPGPLSGD
jgi:hypothetical protein